MHTLKRTLGREVIKSLWVSLWFMFLAFPIVVIQVNFTEGTISWRWKNLFLIGLGAYGAALLWRFFLRQKDTGYPFFQPAVQFLSTQFAAPARAFDFQKNPQAKTVILVCIVLIFLVLPWNVSLYRTNIFNQFFLYILLGLGLNIIVGMAGLLFLGHAAFFAIGAYSYALLNQYFPEYCGFWISLPIGAALAALAGMLLALPVLRLRGDYLAIVTLGFGEIVRLLLLNGGHFTGGASGVANIPRPGLFGMELGVTDATIYLYYIAFSFVVCTIVAVSRLQDSRIGRALQALREDEIACEAMGIDRVGVKLTAFGLGTAWAGLAGVLFAAKTTFINPQSFSFFESATILSAVVLGGMGSTCGVILGAAFLVLLPEYLRAFSEYRMLLFAAAMVVMMVFRPEGLIPTRSRTRIFTGVKAKSLSTEENA